MSKKGCLAVIQAVQDFTGLAALRDYRFLVALSGGPDSVALLLAMAEVVSPGRLRACWVDHGLRPQDELARERLFVEQLCDRLSVPLDIHQIPRGRIEQAAIRDGGIEAAARRFRYAALEEARRASTCNLILTGHTAGDWLETMLMRFFGGSGISGLRGMRSFSTYLARPLLGLDKKDILAFLGAQNQEYSVDSTNLGTDFLRNKMRKGLIPEVLAVFPSALAALKTLADKAQVDEEALESWAESLFSCGRLSASAFYSAPLAVRIRALYRLCLSVACSAEPAHSGGVPSGHPSDSFPLEPPIGRRLPWLFMKQAASASPTSPVLARGAGLKIHCMQGYIYAERLQSPSLVPTGVLSRGFSIEVYAPGRFRIGRAIDCTIYCSSEPGGIRLDAFEWPIIIRSRRSGDSIRLAAGQRRIDRLLADEQVPLSSRDMVPVLEDRNGIVAVLGSLAGFRDLYRRNDALIGQVPQGFLVLEMKGVVSDDAVQR